MAPSPLSAIKLLVCDVDGVLTNGNIVYGDNQLELKSFNIKDGLGIKLAGWSGLPVVWLTGRTSEAVDRRAEELGVQVYQGAADKDTGLRQLVAELEIPLDQVAYIGDDLNDLPALMLVGFPIAVADASEEIKSHAAYITQALGGQGAVREAIEHILRAQHRWEEAMNTFLRKIAKGKSGQ